MVKYMAPPKNTSPASLKILHVFSQIWHTYIEGAIKTTTKVIILKQNGIDLEIVIIRLLTILLTYYNTVTCSMTAAFT